jgi:hypothetical protein
MGDWREWKGSDEKKEGSRSVNFVLRCNGKLNVERSKLMYTQVFNHINHTMSSLTSASRFKNHFPTNT